ncbi:hypothetical protein EW145_g2817 [Phellinidium pouzarii]|uniref:G domain-containing protein n=1 Tax=Phellinidium pouzarii TaxID=167371 RepID=A0A4S4L9P6_9AGAM|nr:hypothetical protein EW145_g2817 [Phellinidium pouzarii]
MRSHSTLLHCRPPSSGLLPSYSVPTMSVSREASNSSTLIEYPTTSSQSDDNEADFEYNDSAEQTYRHEVTHTPESVFAFGLSMVKVVKPILDEVAVRELHQHVWMTDIEKLEREKLPMTRIALCGGTGSGKSTLLNALLGACTAVVTEVSYRSKDGIRALVEFLTLEDWEQELGILLEDINDDELESVSRTDLSELSEVSKVAFDKVILLLLIYATALFIFTSLVKLHAVYPRIAFRDLCSLSVEDILHFDEEIMDLLGKTREVRANDPVEFLSKCNEYMQSYADGKRTIRSVQVQDARPALWPLIRQIKIGCKSPILESGVTLVDLPGVADANSARNNVAKEYLKRCNHIWVIAEIKRASLNLIPDLLGRSFKAQCMNGCFDNVEDKITFIATNCDIINRIEIARELGLDDDPEYVALDESIENIGKDISILEAGLETTLSHDGKNDISSMIRTAMQMLMPRRVSDSMPSCNRTFGPMGSTQKRTIDQFGSDDPKFGPKRMKYSASTSQSHLEAQSLTNKFDLSMMPSIFQIPALREQEKELQLQVKSYCAMKRSELSREALRIDFREGLRQMDACAAEEQQKGGYGNESLVIYRRDYEDINLPVFTVSSRDFLILTSQVRGDGGPSCFTNEEDTGIPALRRRCYELTADKRNRAARLFIRSLYRHLSSVGDYLEGLTVLTEENAIALRDRWKSDRTFLLQKNRKSEDYLSKDACKARKNSKGLAFELYKAVYEAPRISKRFRTSMHAQQYIAALRRNGVWRLKAEDCLKDLNAEVTGPMVTHAFASSWARVFSNISVEPEELIMAAIEAKLNDVETSVPAGLRERTRQQKTKCLDDSRDCIESVLGSVRLQTNIRQKELSRKLEPFVKEQLADAYSSANALKGKGSINKKMETIHDFLEENARGIFKRAQGMLHNGLDNIIGKDIGSNSAT